MAEQRVGIFLGLGGNGWQIKGGRPFLDWEVMGGRAKGGWASFLDWEVMGGRSRVGGLSWTGR